MMRPWLLLASGSVLGLAALAAAAPGAGDYVPTVEIVHLGHRIERFQVVDDRARVRLVRRELGIQTPSFHDCPRPTIAADHVSLRCPTPVGAILLDARAPGPGQGDGGVALRGTLSIEVEGVVRLIRVIALVHHPATTR
jgi:hypothetical protein